jgi:hypothetical protein
MHFLMAMSFFDSIAQVCQLLLYTGNSTCSCWQCCISNSLATLCCSQHCHPGERPVGILATLFGWNNKNMSMQDGPVGIYKTEGLEYVLPPLIHASPWMSCVSQRAPSSVQSFQASAIAASSRFEQMPSPPAPKNCDLEIDTSTHIRFWMLEFTCSRMSL